MDRIIVNVQTGDVSVVPLTEDEIAALPQPEPESPASIRARMGAAIQRHLDAEARARGYDSALSCVSYLDSTVVTFAAEARAMRDWRDTVWQIASDIEADVMSGQIAVPTEDALIGMLPAIVWP